jgi:hypothetical protein
MKTFILTVALTFFYASLAAAAVDQSPAGQFKTKTTSLFLKTCAKAYLMNEDFQKLRNNKMAAISRMTEPQFGTEYVQAWAVLQKCPYLVKKYRLRQNLAKKEALGIVSRLTRQECLDAVDNIPDEVFVGLFNDAMNNPEMKDKSLNEQVGIIMNKSLGSKGK